MRYIFDNYLGDDVAMPEVAESLLAKKLIKETKGELLLEPVALLLAKAALLAQRLWLAKQADGGTAWLVLECAEFYLLCQQYPYIAEAWKITPCQNREAVCDECGEVDFSKALIGEEVK
jgi:hypothetical protein